MNLRDDIRGQRVFDEGDPVTQVKFALLQPLNLNDILPGGSLKGLDRGIEVAMLLLQLRQLRPEFRLFLLCHMPPRCRVRIDPEGIFASPAMGCSQLNH